MRCKKCGHENRDGRKFCGGCGEELPLICPDCGFSNTPDDKFCGGCANQLAQEREPAPARSEEAPSEPAGELRQVTVIFADIAEYTRLSTEKDPEEIHRILSRFFELADGALQSYGGRIDKHIGDAVMGVFGAPLAHGNDPERAVRAAIDIHGCMEQLSTEVGTGLKVHVGIASGQVVASGLGSAAHKEYTVTGESVNLASRLAEKADPGETLISDAVHSSTHKLVDAQMVGDVMIKGLSRPVNIWKLNSIAGPSPSSERRPIVGRVTELRLYRGILDTSLETGKGHVLYIRGEAGIGKTRLVEEFWAVSESQGVRCYKGLILDFGVGSGQDAIRAIVRSLLDLSPGSVQNEREHAVRSALSNKLLNEDQTVFLNDLLDVPQSSELRAIYDAMDNQTRNKGKQHALATLLERISLTHPLMIVVEDMHWADNLTLEYLAELSRGVSNYPLIVVITSRIEGDQLEQMRRYAAGTITLTTLDLGPLCQDESLEFASEFFAATNRFANDCVDRAEGNPLFLEQLLLSTSEDNSEEVPGSVNSIVLARIDNLTHGDKQAFQAASVLGQRFSLNVLKFLIDNPEYDPEELVTHYLIRPMEGEYIFSHALVWESVYSSLLRGRRKDLHDRAAVWFSDKDLELYAEHLERAQNPAAANAYVEAARSQINLFHFENALRSIDRGLAIAIENEDTYNLLMLKGQCLREMGKPVDSIALYRSALEASETDVDKCRARIGLAAGMRVTDNFDEALKTLQEAEDVALASNLPLELSQIQYYRGNLYFPLGDIKGCLEQHALSLKTAQKAGLPECEARALSGLGDAHYAHGRMITSLNYFKECIRLCRTHGFGRIQVENQYMVAWNRLYLSEVSGSLEDALVAIDEAHLAGHKRAELVSRITAARTLTEMNDLDTAELHIERGLELAEELGARRFIPFCKIIRARVKNSRDGFHASTIDIMKVALEVSRSTGIEFLGPWVLSTLALVTEDEKSSLAALDEGEDILKGGCVGHNYIDFYRDAMEVALRHGNWDLTDRYANSLQNYTSEEPLPWAEHYITRGRALSTHGRAPTKQSALELTRVKEMSLSRGLMSGIAAIEEALGS